MKWSVHFGILKHYGVCCYKYWILSLVVFLVTSQLCGQQNHNPEQVFTVAQLKDDIRYLFKNLAAKYPNLYLYTPKPEIEKIIR